MDLQQIEAQILQLLALVVGFLVVWLLQRLLAWLGIHLNADRQTALTSAVDKMMTLGVTKATSIISQRGWDHVDTKNAVINYALPLLETKFSETLAAAGLDPTNPVDRVRLVDVMERMWPDVATRAAASPATPPSPVVPVVMAAAAPAV